MSSSSSCFGSDEECRIPLVLGIYRSDGSEEILPEGPVILRNGANVAFDVPDDDDEITIDVNPGIGNEDPYFRQKFDSLSSLTDANDAGTPISGPFPDPFTGVTPVGDPWSFTRESLWIGAVNNLGADPLSGAFFIVGDACTSLGAFEDNTGLPQALGGRLSVLDICLPCLDCLTYARLNDYLQRIDVFYTYVLDLVLNEDTETIPEHPDGGIREVINGVLPNFLSSQRYWDHLVHKASVKFSAQVVGQAISTAAFYRNISEDEVGPTISVSILYEFFEDGVPWAGLSDKLLELRVLPRDGIANDDVLGISNSNLSIQAGNTSALVTMETTAVVASGSAMFSDHALLIKGFDLFDEEKNYTVKATLTLAPTHLSPSSQVRQITIFFVPGTETEEEEEP
jgi:hypothetical protein